MFTYYNANPVAAREEDCAVRAVSAALGISWDEAFDLIAHNAKQMATTMENDAAWGSVLRQHGFYRRVIPNSCPECYSIKDFTIDHPFGDYVLGTGTHAVAVIDGDILDIWDSSYETPQYYWERMYE